MPQQVIVDKKRVRVIEVGPVGPPGKPGARGPTGPPGPEGLIEALIVHPGSDILDVDSMYLLSGTHDIPENITLNGRVAFQYGAKIRPGIGVVVSIAGVVEAGAWHVFDTSLGGSFRFTEGARVGALVDWFGAKTGQDSTNAFQQAISAVSWGDTDDALSRTLYALDGKYIINDELVANTPVVIEGQTPYGTRLVVGDDFPDDGYLVRFEREAGVLVKEESHIPGFGLRNIGLDGNKRTKNVHAIYLDFVDRSEIDNVWVRWFRGSVLTYFRSVRECNVNRLRTWFCGSPEDVVLNLFDNATVNDGSNLNRFVDCNFALCMGDFMTLGTSSAATVARCDWFTNCSFHGLNEWIDAYPDNYYPSVVNLGSDAGASKQRINIQNARDVFFDDCRIIGFGRGHPLFNVIQDPTLGALSQNHVRIANSALYRGGYSPRSITTVDTAEDTFLVTSMAGSDPLSNGHYATTGSKVQIGGTPPAPLAILTDYYLIRVDSTKFKLALTRADAISGIAIDITTTGTSPTVTQLDQCVTTVNASTDVLTIGDHRLTTGARIRVASDSTLPTGLVADTDYFVIRVDANTIKLSTTRLNAEAGTAIDITTVGSGNIYIVVQDFYSNVEWGTIGWGSGNTFDYISNRGLARIEAAGGGTSITVDPGNLTAGQLPVERSDGGIYTMNSDANWQLENNRAFCSKDVDGTTVGLAKVTSAGVVVLGNYLNAGLGTQVVSKLSVDAIVDGLLKIRATTQGISFNGVTAPPLPSGWTALTGTATKGGGFDTASVTLPQLAQVVKAMLDFLMSRGDMTT